MDTKFPQLPKRIIKQEAKAFQKIAENINIQDNLALKADIECEEIKNEIYEFIPICNSCKGHYIHVKDNEYKCDHCGNLYYYEGGYSLALKSNIEKADFERQRANFDEAHDIYAQILLENPNLSEVYFGLLLCDYGIVYVKDPNSDRYLPTCNRTSNMPIKENLNYQKVLEFARTDDEKRIYEFKANEVEFIRERIILLSKNQENFDIFISYKRTIKDLEGKELITLDSIKARDIYDVLTRNGYKVFLAEKTLLNQAGQEYEPIIYNALNTSKVLILICSQKSNIESAWVKNEWSRFLKHLEYNQEKKIIPIVCEQFSVNDLPDKLKKFQALNIEVNFTENLLKSVENIMQYFKKSIIKKIELGDKINAKKIDFIEEKVQKRNFSKKINDEELSSFSLIFTYLNKANYDLALFNLKKFRQIEHNVVIEWLYDIALILEGKSKKVKSIDIVLTDFERAMEQSSEDLAEAQIRFLANVCLDKINETKFDFALKVFKAMMAWEFDGTDKIIEKMQNGIMKSKYLKANEYYLFATLFLQSHNSKSVDDYINKLNQFHQGAIYNYVRYNRDDINWLLNSILFLDDIIKLDEGNDAIRFEIILLSIGVVDKKDLWTAIDSFEQFDEFEMLLKFCNFEKREQYLNVMLQAIIEAVYKNEGKPKQRQLVLKIDLIFEKFISYYQEGSIELCNEMYKFANCLQQQWHFDIAIKYFKYLINENCNCHLAFWHILQCKLGCINDEELINSKKPIGKINAFNCAIDSADSGSVDKYLSIKKKQDEKLKERKKRNKEKGIVWGFTILFLLFFIGLISGVIDL